jgi:hypothetical protein
MLVLLIVGLELEQLADPSINAFAAYVRKLEIFIKLN